MLDDLFDSLDSEYRMKNVAVICENIDEILKLTSDFYLREGATQDKAIEAVVQIFLKHKKFEKKAPPQNYEVRSHCC